MGCYQFVPTTFGSGIQVERLAATSALEVRVPGVSEIAQKLSSAVAAPARDVVSAARRKQIAADSRQTAPGDNTAHPENSSGIPYQ